MVKSRKRDKETRQWCTSKTWPMEKSSGFKSGGFLEYVRYTQAHDLEMAEAESQHQDPLRHVTFLTEEINILE